MKNQNLFLLKQKTGFSQPYSEQLITLFKMCRSMSVSWSRRYHPLGDNSDGRRDDREVKQHKGGKNAEALINHW